MQRIWNEVRSFLRRLFRRPDVVPGTVDDGPEVELEAERKRGMRGL